MSAKTSTKLNPAIFDTECPDFFDPGYWQNKGAIVGNEKGRGTTWFVRHGNHELVLRHYYRGGFISRFNRDCYLFTGLENTRAFKEYATLETLKAKGLRVPEPAGARVTQHGLFYRADLITRRIENAHDLLQCLQTPAADSLIDSIAESISLLHKAGVMHPDLNIQNILVDSDNLVWVIDFDQAKIIELSSNSKSAMLARLKRSFEKEVLRHGIKWSAENWALFEARYQFHSHQ